MGFLHAGPEDEVADSFFNFSWGYPVLGAGMKLIWTGERYGYSDVAKGLWNKIWNDGHGVDYNVK